MFTKKSMTIVASQTDPAPLCSLSKAHGSLPVEGASTWLGTLTFCPYPGEKPLSAFLHPRKLPGHSGLEFHGSMGSYGQPIEVDVYLCV